MSNDELIEIGKITSKTDRYGFVRIVTSLKAGQIKKIDKILGKGKDGSSNVLKIEDVSLRNNDIFIKFHLFGDNRKVEFLFGKTLFLTKSKLLEIREKGSFYYFEFEGLDAIDTQGNKLGVVKEMDEYSGTDYLIIENNGKEFLVPYINQFIVETNLECKQVVINVIEGLVE